MLVQASQDALRHLEIIMVGTKFPENIGMAARACANTGCGRLTLVSPAWWDKEKARPLATAKGEPLLDAIEVKPTLGDALAPNVLTFGTTARTGGWRRGLLTPEQAPRRQPGRHRLRLRGSRPEQCRHRTVPAPRDHPHRWRGFFA